MAFSGDGFKNYYFSQSSDSSDLGIISQNFLNMFSYDQVPAIVVRLMIYI